MSNAFDLARNLANESDDETEVMENVEDAAEALQESRSIEESPALYAAKVKAQAHRIAKASPSEDTDELTNYLNEVTRNRAPMNKQQAIDAARRGDLSALIEGNLLLVVSVALKWRGFNRSIMDLIGEGNVGLTTAAGKYDVDRGFAFSTYGVFYIRKDIRTEAMRQDTQYASIPPATRRQLSALYIARFRLERAEGRSLTLRQTAERLRAEDAQRDKEHRRGWPDDTEVLALLSAMGTDYISKLLVPDARGHLFDTNTRYPQVTDTLAMDPAYDPIRELEAKWELEDSATAWIRDLRTAHATGDLSDDELHLLCVRFGLPHPDTHWVPPIGWEIGHVHSLRWTARATGRKYEWTRLRLLKIIAALKASPSPIARRIARLTQSPRPLIRYRAGVDA